MAPAAAAPRPLRRLIAASVALCCAAPLGRQRAAPGGGLAAPALFVEPLATCREGPFRPCWPSAACASRVRLRGRSNSDRVPRQQLRQNLRTPPPTDWRRSAAQFRDPLSWRGGGQPRWDAPYKSSLGDVRGGGLDLDSGEEKRARLWAELLDDPAQWLDYRALKAEDFLASGHPDFRKPGTRDQLWVDMFLMPDDVATRFLAADEAQTWRVATRQDIVEEHWRSLFNERDKWVDLRAKKKAGLARDSQADFEQEASGLRLTIGAADTPSWVLEDFAAEKPTDEPRWKVAGMQQAVEIWRTLFQEPAKWLDLRPMKAAGRAVAEQPDFLHLWSGQALWTEAMPTWAVEKVRLVDATGVRVWPTSRDPAGS